MKDEATANGPVDHREEISNNFSSRPQFKDPISNASAAWLASLAKALRGTRVYEANNQMLQRFHERALADLAVLHSMVEEITFGVREDRLLHASTIGGLTRIDTAEVDSPLVSPAEVVGQIAKKLAPVRQAYEDLLVQRSTLGGQIVVAFRIDQGRARQVTFAADEVNDPTVRAALEAAAGTWLWPGRDGVSVEAHFTLKPVRREDAVLVDPDRQEGMPFAFYRNGFRRLSFARGFGAEQLTLFLRAVATDFGAIDNVGEDLVSVLWRLDLPYFRYLTIDGLTIGAASGTQNKEHDSQEIDRLQADIDNLVAQIYAAHSKNVASEDLVKNASITRDDLGALEGIRSEAPEDLDLLDVVTERAIANVPRAELDRIVRELKEDDRDVVLLHLVEAMVSVLYSVRSSAELGPKIGTLQQLFDALLLRAGFRHATALLEQIRAGTEDASDIKRRHISRHIQKMFATESRIAQVALAFNDPLAAASAADILAFLRCLGTGIVKPLLRALESVTAPLHRRLLVDLVAELEMPSAETLRTTIQGAKWFVVVDLLGLVSRLSLAEQAPILRETAEHENPKVRAQTVGMLRAFPEGGADDIIAKAIEDAEAEVRINACRVAAARLSRKAGHAIGAWLRSDRLGHSEPREMNAMMLAFAQIGGSEAVDVLDQLLNPRLFSGRTEVQVSAAIALASIPTPESKRAVQRGMRTLNARVREACKQALARLADTSQQKRGHDSTVGQGFDPFASIQATVELRPIEGTPAPDLEMAPAVEPPPAQPEAAKSRLIPIPAAAPPPAGAVLPEPARSSPPPEAAWAASARPSYIVRGGTSQDILPTALPPMAIEPTRRTTDDLAIPILNPIETPLEAPPAELDPSADLLRQSPFLRPPPRPLEPPVLAARPFGRSLSEPPPAFAPPPRPLEAHGPMHAAASGTPFGAPSGMPFGAASGTPFGAPSGTPFGAPSGTPFGAPPTGRSLEPMPVGMPLGPPQGMPHFSLPPHGPPPLDPLAFGRPLPEPSFGRPLDPHAFTGLDPRASSSDLRPPVSEAPRSFPPPFARPLPSAPSFAPPFDPLAFGPPRESPFAAPLDPLAFGPPRESPFAAPLDPLAFGRPMPEASGDLPAAHRGPFTRPLPEPAAPGPGPNNPFARPLPEPHAYSQPLEALAFARPEPPFPQPLDALALAGPGAGSSLLGRPHVEPQPAETPSPTGPSAWVLEPSPPPGLSPAPFPPFELPVEPVERPVEWHAEHPKPAPRVVPPSWSSAFVGPSSPAPRPPPPAPSSPASTPFPMAEDLALEPHLRRATTSAPPPRRSLEGEPALRASIEPPRPKPEAPVAPPPPRPSPQSLPPFEAPRSPSRKPGSTAYSIVRGQPGEPRDEPGAPKVRPTRPDEGGER